MHTHKNPAPTSPKAGPPIFVNESRNAKTVSPAPCTPGTSSTPEQASTRPVTEQTTSVSKNVPVILKYPCFAGDDSDDAAAVMAAEPSPASFEKMPRAVPKRTAEKSVPAAPPQAALTEKAD